MTDARSRQARSSATASVHSSGARTSRCEELVRPLVVGLLDRLPRVLERLLVELVEDPLVTGLEGRDRRPRRATPAPASARRGRCSMRNELRTSAEPTRSSSREKRLLASSSRRRCRREPSSRARSSAQSSERRRRTASDVDPDPPVAEAVDERVRAVRRAARPVSSSTPGNVQSRQHALRRRPARASARSSAAPPPPRRPRSAREARRSCRHELVERVRELADASKRHRRTRVVAARRDG